jgi:hypothetical protein
MHCNKSTYLIDILATWNISRKLPRCGDPFSEIHCEVMIPLFVLQQTHGKPGTLYNYFHLLTVHDL